MKRGRLQQHQQHKPVGEPQAKLSDSSSAASCAVSSISCETGSKEGVFDSSSSSSSKKGCRDDHRTLERAHELGKPGPCKKTRLK
jgi:hypothetical protein